MNTRGIHWIVTTHGTWLHGDVRGSWRDGKLVGPDPFLEEAIKARMTHDAVLLTDDEVRMVAAEFGATCKEQGHRVLAATVRHAHAHLIFAPMREDIHTVIARLKYRAACTVLAVRRNMHQPAPRSLWTGGQFPVFIFDDAHLHNAVAYVRKHNLRAGLAANPYDWIDPGTPGSVPI